MSISAKNWAWATTELTSPDGRVLKLKAGPTVTLARLADFENAQKGYAYPTVETLARETGQSRRATETSLSLLEEYGALTRVKFSASVGGKHVRNRYLLHVPESYRKGDDEWQRWNTT